MNSAAKGEVEATRVNQPNRGDLCNIPICKNENVGPKIINLLVQQPKKKKGGQAVLDIGNSLTESDPSNIWPFDIHKSTTILTTAQYSVHGSTNSSDPFKLEASST